MIAAENLPEIPQGIPVLIAGATASGKSALALYIAKTFGGVIINADASQVYDCWRIITARPSIQEEARAPHRLYGHVPWNAEYSAGHWLRDAAPLIHGAARPIIVGGTGLYFTAVTRGMADIPATPPEIRQAADALPLKQLVDALDNRTAEGIDLANRARVQRAWEVLQSTGQGLADWQRNTPPPLLPPNRAVTLVVDMPKDRLEDRIRRRFQAMLNEGALQEVAAMRQRYDPSLPSCRAIGVRELIAHLRGEATLEEATDHAIIATRQFAKRQRTWFRSRMRDWHWISPGG